jgi:hypothetical protein
LSNETPAPGNWIAVRPVGVVSCRDGIGVRLEVHTAKWVRIAENLSGDGFYSSNERICRVGLGASTEVEKIVVRWPSGRVDVVEHPAINQVHRWKEGR